MPVSPPQAAFYCLFWDKTKSFSPSYCAEWCSQNVGNMQKLCKRSGSFICEGCYPNKYPVLAKQMWNLLCLNSAENIIALSIQAAMILNKSLICWTAADKMSCWLEIKINLLTPESPCGDVKLLTNRTFRQSGKKPKKRRKNKLSAEDFTKYSTKLVQNGGRLHFKINIRATFTVKTEIWRMNCCKHLYINSILSKRPKSNVETHSSSLQNLNTLGFI